MKTVIISSVATLVLVVMLVLALSYHSSKKGSKGMISRRGDFVDLHVRLPLPFLFSAKRVFVIDAISMTIYVES